MADRTSADLFGQLFTFFANDSDDRIREMAREVYSWTQHYDFNSYQMECDDALIILDLAKLGPDGEGGKRVLYLGEDYGEFDLPR